MTQTANTTHYSQRSFSISAPLRGFVGLATALILILGGIASAALPAPGTAQEVKALVDASAAIQKLPAVTLPPLLKASGDYAGRYFAGAGVACSTVTQCVYGDKLSKTVVVLFGDSHAPMWLSALSPWAKSGHLRLVLLWHAACADVNIVTRAPYCRTFRSTTISAIQKLKPAIVILSNRTSKVVSASGLPFTDKQWQTAQEQTIAALATATTKVVVLGDIAEFNVAVPECLGSYPSSVQKCAVPWPNPKFTQHYEAEKLAAVAQNAGYVDTSQWLCRATCSPLIGKMIAYYDADHVSSTYGAWLAGVMGGSLKTLTGR